MRSSATGLGLSPELERLLRRADPQAGPRLEAIRRVRQDIRTRKAQWNAADSLTGLTVLDDGGVRLTDTVTTLIQQDSAETAFFQDAELDGRLPFTAAVLELAGTEPAEIEIKRVKAKLHPRRDPAQPKQVAKWRLDLLRIVRVGVLMGIPARRQLFLAPIAEPLLVDAVGDANGYVTWDYSIAPVIERPRPKRYGTPPFAELFGNLFHAAPAPTLVLAISALKADGSPAGNVGLAYDAAQASVTTGGNVLSGRKFELPAPGLGLFLSVALFEPGTHADGGAAAGTPRIIIESGTYTSDEIAFTGGGNKYDLGAAPDAANDVVFTIQGAVPNGTALRGQVLKDGGNPAVGADWRTFLSGQKSTDLADVSKRQTYELRAQLDTDASAALTPTLRKLAVEELQTSDMSDYAELQLQGGWGIDAVSLKGEIVRGTIVGKLDGERDYRSGIEDLLAAADLADYTFRPWIGAASLAKDKWLHLDDFIPEGQRPRAADYAIPVVSPLILIRGLLPKYSPGTVYAPDGDVAVGAYTTETGGGANLYLKINEAAADDLTYIRSELDPVNSLYKASFPTPTDFVGRRMYLDYRFQKDAAAGKTIDATIELRQTTTLISFQAHADISDVLTAGSFRLTEAQVALITDPTNLQLWVTFNVGGAGGSRRGIVTWARLRTEGRKDAVRYSNVSVKAAFDDIIANQLEIDPKWRGPGLEDTTTLVSKVISEVTDDDEPTSKAELDALAASVGYGLLGSQGQLKAVNMQDPGPIVAYFPMEEVRIVAITLGIEERIEEFVVPFNWNVAEGKFDDEWRGASAAGVLAFGEAKLDTPVRLDSEIGEWIIPQAGADYVVHARRVGQRHITWFGAGRGRADFVVAYMHPELEPGDTVALEQDQLVFRDPHTGTEVRGRRWVIGKLELCNDPRALGLRFTMAFRPLVDLLTDGEAATRFFKTLLLSVQLVWRGDHLFVLWVGNAATASVKVATSTVSQPAAATGTTAEGQSGEVDAGAFTYTPRIYVTVTPYSRPTAGGVEGDASFESMRLPYIQTMFDSSTGKPLRSTAFNDQGAFLPFVSPNPGTFFSYASGGPASGQMWISFDWSASTLYRPDASTLTVPAPPAAPGAPTLSQVVGGALGARTRWARIAYLKTDPFTGHQTLYPVSAEASFAISANNLLKVTSPADPGGGLYSGWAVLVGSASNTEYVQGANALIAFGTDWTEPTGGFSTTQNSLWTTSWKKLTKIGLDPATLYKHYPYYNLALDFVFIPAETTNAHPQLASLQNGDGVLSLGRYGSAAGYSGVIDISTPAAASTGSGNVGGGRLT